MDACEARFNLHYGFYNTRHRYHGFFARFTRWPLFANPDAGTG